MFSLIHDSRILPSSHLAPCVCGPPCIRGYGTNDPNSPNKPDDPNSSNKPDDHNNPNNPNQHDDHNSPNKPKYS